MPNEAGTFISPTGERKAFRFGTQPQDWTLETQAPQPQAQPQTYTDFINQAYQNPQLQEARETLSDLTTKAPTYYEDTLAGLKTKDQTLQQLQQQRGKFVSDLYAAPSEAKQQYSDIFDPVKREALIARATGNIMGQLDTTNSMIENRGGTLEQQANTALKLFESQLGAAQGQYTDLKDMLTSIANKDYEALQSQIKRQQDLEDYFTKYTGKLEIDKSLGIGDFKPSSSGSQTSAGTWTDKYTGQTFKTQTDFKTGQTNYVPIGTPQSTDFTRWVDQKSQEYQMSLDPNSPDVRASFDAEQESNQKLTFSQQEDTDFRSSLQDAISAIDGGMKEDNAKETLRRLFPDRAKEIDDAFSY